MVVQATSMVEKLREQRDRFIAFAFAGADLLLELKDDQTVSYSAGAGESLYGLSDGALMGRDFGEFVYPRDRKRYDDALLRLKNTGRLDHTQLSIMGNAGTLTRMRMAGIRLPQFPDCYHLSLSRIPPMALAEDARQGADPKAAFIDLVRQRLNEGNRTGEEYKLTLVDLSRSNFKECEPAALQSFLATVTHVLEECSVRQSSAAALGDRAFGLIHAPETDTNLVKKRIAETAAKFKDKLPGAALDLRANSLDLEDSTLTDEDISKALSFIINGFVKDSASFAIKTLVDGARVAVEDTLVRVKNFRSMLKNDSLTFVFQPIVNLHTGAVLKYEAFGRIKHEGRMFSPAHIIPFATEVGLIGEFDLFACRKALSMMQENTTLSSLAHVSVNVSGQSLGNPGFYHALLKMLEENKKVLPRLVLEVTEASSIYNLDEARRLLTRIKRLGARISLDDFGTGGAAFDVLRTLPADFTKIEPSYIVNAREPKGRSVLRALSSLCKDLGIVTIAERVEDRGTMELVREVGIDYAQGHYFGQPAADAAKKIVYFKEAVGAAMPQMAAG
jgi:EAL domain-containing protein (putative c-di-GMP-specific phosphodiesterase class I)